MSFTAWWKEHKDRCQCASRIEHLLVEILFVLEQIRDEGQPHDAVGGSIVLGPPSPKP